VRRIGAVVVLALAAAAPAGAALTLDTTFGYQGTVGIPHSTGTAVLALPDGRILVGGSNNGLLSLVRLMPNGSIDTSFGNGGVDELDCGQAGPALMNGITALGLAASGSIVVAGPSQDFGYFIALRKADGSGCDTSLGGQNLPGHILGPSSGSASSPTSMMVDGSGRISIGPIAAGNPAVRVDANGTGDGPPSPADLESIGGTTDILFQPDGSYFAALVTGANDLIVAHLLPSWTMDSSYGTGGLAQLALPDVQRSGAIVRLGDGSIVDVGSATGAVVAAHFLANGSVDTSWGSGGIVTIPLADPVHVGDAIVDSAGNIAAVGSQGSGAAPWILELGQNGSVVTPPTAIPGGFSGELALAPDGGLLAVSGVPNEAFVTRFGGSAGGGAPSAGGSSGGGSSTLPTGSGLPDLQLALTAESTVAPPVGSQLVYHVTVGDKPGAGGSFDVTTTVNLPAGFVVTKTYSDRGKGCSGMTPPLTCDLDWISPSVVGHITIWGTVGKAGPQTASASVHEGPGELNPADNSATLVLQPTTPLVAALRVRTPPELSGVARPGHTLVATKVRWNGAPTAVSYQWQLCLGPRCAPIHGATSLTLKLLPSYAGYDVRLVETGRNAAGALASSSKRLLVRKR